MKRAKKTIKEIERLAEVQKDKVFPPKCTCKLGNTWSIKTSVAKCPAHGNDRAAWRNL